jgi:hypothetical protein
MKTLFRRSLAAFLISLLGAANAAAQETQSLKIAVVITQRLLTSTVIGKGAATELRGKKDEAQTELVRKASEIGELK